MCSLCHLQTTQTTYNNKSLNSGKIILTKGAYYFYKKDKAIMFFTQIILNTSKSLRLKNRSHRPKQNTRVNFFKCNRFISSNQISEFSICVICCMQGNLISATLNSLTTISCFTLSNNMGTSVLPSQARGRSLPALQLSVPSDLSKSNRET